MAQRVRSTRVYLVSSSATKDTVTIFTVPKAWRVLISTVGPLTKGQTKGHGAGCARDADGSPLRSRLVSNSIARYTIHSLLFLLFTSFYSLLYLHFAHDFAWRFSHR